MGADGTDKPVDKEVEGSLSSRWVANDAEHGDRGHSSRRDLGTSGTKGSYSSWTRLASQSLLLLNVLTTIKLIARMDSVVKSPAIGFFPR